ncbi:MAG TPA: FdhF/YdeP family oxidoreductase [Candidatus Polarisedimenticolaceae bacterium]|nr:FdhF/YdeP family oxidoreductase [Candidatus Polarisedimenticolaceae bacterium]
MPKPRVSAAGGLAAIGYTLKKGREAGGLWRLYTRLRSRNACKTCAFGMGGQRGGMVNEQGRWPEVCKKSIQAQAGDMQAPLTEAFFARHSLAELERFTSRQLEHAGRLVFPIVADARDVRFRRIGWDEALARLSDDLRAAPPEQTFVYASGRSSNEAAFLLQMLARAYGTPNIHNCSSYCHQASGVALSRMIGSGTATVVLEDLDHADCMLLVGANPASNHPRLIVKMVELRKRGGRVIVINPVRELGLERFRIPSKPGSLLFGSTVSDLYLQPHVGSDITVFRALLKGLLERSAEDRDYLARYAEGWEAVERDARTRSWQSLLDGCGLRRDEIERAVDILAAARRGIALWAMGLTHHEHGVDNVLALGNLAAARGWVGRAGSGLMPIRGHSNVQGVGSVGFTPALKRAFAEKMAELYGIDPRPAGMDTFASMTAAEQGKVRVALMLGGNLWGSNPDLGWATRAMRRIGTTAYITTKLNPGHVHGRGSFNLVLPVLARDEETQPTTQESMFNFVRLSDGGAAAPSGEAISEVALVASLARRLLPDAGFPFERMTSHATIRRAIADVVPGYRAIGRIDESRNEFQIEGRTFHEPRFSTPSGKLVLHVPRETDWRPADGAFRLMTLRSEGQFNTVVYEDEDLYRGTTRRDVVMMHPRDGERLGVREGRAVSVETEVGALPAVVAFIDIAPGNLAMYYPEANAIVPRRVDRDSGTPAFKSVSARIVV